MSLVHSHFNVGEVKLIEPCNEMRKFDTSDRLTYRGALDFPDGSPPLIAEVTINTTTVPMVISYTEDSEYLIFLDDIYYTRICTSLAEAKDIANKLLSLELAFIHLMQYNFKEC